MIPLVVFDLDGTMIGSSGTVEACIYEAVDTALEAGVRLVVATGRPGFGVARKVAERIGPTSPHIFQNGAHIAYLDRRNLTVSALPESASRQMIEAARTLNAPLELYTPTDLFVERQTPLSTAHARMLGVTAIVGDLTSVVNKEPVIRAQWLVGSHQLAAIEAITTNGFEIGVATSPVITDTLFVSVTRAGVTKGSAIEILCDSLQVPLANTMAVGDSIGDLAMLERVGVPVVVANAAAPLLELVTHQVAGVDDCGAAEALALATTLAT